MPDDKAQVKFGADIEELKSKMDEGDASVKNALDNMKANMEKTASATEAETAKMGAAFKGLETAAKSAMGAISFKAFAAEIGAAVAAVMFFAGSTAKWADEVGKLSVRLGISTQQASGLAMSLKILGMSSDDYLQIAQRLERQVKINADVLEKLGIVLKDPVTGNARDLADVMEQVRAKIASYAQGGNQAQMAMALLGGRIGDLTRFLRLNNEMLENGSKAAERFNMVLDPAAVAAAHKYEESLNTTKEAVLSLARQIGAELMPPLESLSTWLNTTGVESWKKYYNAINDTINAQMRFMGILPELPAGMSEEQARTSGTPGGGRWGKLPAAPAPAGKQGADEEIAAAQDKKGGVGKDLMAQWSEEASRLKDSQTDLNAWSAQMDFQFWAEKIATTQHGSDQWWAIMHKMADDLRTLGAEQKAEAEKQAKQQEAVSKGIAAMQKSDSETAIKIEEEKINMLFGLGQISASQRYNMLKAEYDKEYALEIKAYSDELARLRQRGDQTLEQQMKVNEEIEKAQNQHLLKMQKDENQYLNTQKQQWDKYATDVGNALTGMLFHHQTFLQTMQSLEEKAFSYIIDTLLKKMVGAWLASEQQKNVATQTGAATRAASEDTGFFSSMLAKIGQQLASWLGLETSKTAATTTGAAARATAEAAAALAGKAAQTAQNIGAITADAAVAYAGAYAATASIPMVGPAMAPGVASAAMAEVLSMIGMASFDLGAWEIPRDMTARLHAGETVVPKTYAEGLRSQGGGGDPRGGDMHMHFQATDAESFGKQLTRSNSDLNRMIKKSIRNFNLPIRR